MSILSNRSIQTNRNIPACLHFLAEPDLSLFRFNTGFAGCAVFELRFTSRQAGIYDAAVEYIHCFPDTLCTPLTDSQVEELLLVLMQMIEQYTQKYPDRVIRLRGGNRLQAMLFRVMLLIHQDVLRPWFTIDEQERKALLPFFPGRPPSTFLLKRRPDVCLPSHPVQTILHTRSRLFGNPVHIRVVGEVANN